MNNPNCLASLPYTTTAREVGSEEIHIIKSEHAIDLYEDVLVTSTGEYPIDNVWDISCKSFSGDAKLLYLHTNQGVRTYEIEGDPEPFLAAFRQVKGRL